MLDYLQKMFLLEAIFSKARNSELRMHMLLIKCFETLIKNSCGLTQRPDNFVLLLLQVYFQHSLHYHLSLQRLCNNTEQLLRNLFKTAEHPLCAIELMKYFLQPCACKVNVFSRCRQAFFLKNYCNEILVCDKLKCNQNHVKRISS